MRSGDLRFVDRGDNAGCYGSFGSWILHRQDQYVSLLLIALVAIALPYGRVGAIRLHDKPTERLIERFIPFERSAHMIKAVAFSVLAISGLVMAFAKFFILPIVGTTLIGWPLR